MSRQGSTLAGVMDAFSVAISIGLQYGVPLETYASKFVNMRFEPAGMTDDPDVRMAASVMDYIFRRLALDFLPYERRSELGIFTASERAAQLRAEAAAASTATPVEEHVDFAALASSPPIEAPATSEKGTTATAASDKPASAKATGGAAAASVNGSTANGSAATGGAAKGGATKGGAAAATDKTAGRPVARAGSSMELLELVQGKGADAPLCFTCGTKMRPAGSCYVCEGCGSTSGCS